MIGTKTDPHGYGGLSRGEIAAMLGVTSTRVGQVERSALTKMRGRVGSDWHPEFETRADRFSSTVGSGDSRCRRAYSFRRSARDWFLRPTTAAEHAALKEILALLIGKPS